MTRKEFAELDLGMQLLVVKAIGELVGKLERSKESLLCYSVELFFVELVYSTEGHELLRVVNFDQGRQLDKYSNLGDKV